MPPKAKRYIVQVKDPLLSSWRVISGPLTAGDANKLIGMISWDARKTEVFE
jgi:hypothetical protein